MLAGSTEGMLKGVTAVSIHGQPYYDLYYQLSGDQEDQPRVARIGTESVYPDPKPGDRVRLHFVMNVVVRVERA